MLEIKGRTVVITGGATGIGFGIAKACGLEGVAVFGMDELTDALRESFIEIRRAAGLSEKLTVVETAMPV